MAMSDAMEQKYKKRDDASARLGEKMLQGWTLLGLTCPADGCFTPFVRNKQGQMYCVNCEQFAVTEEEAARAREQQAQEQQAQEQQQCDEELAAHEAQQEREREQRIAQRFREEEQQRKAAEQQQLERARAATQHNGPAKRKSEQVPLSMAADDDRVKALRHQTLAALYQKVEALTHSLNASDHSERLVTVAKTIRELTEAIKTLSSSEQ